MKLLRELIRIQHERGYLDDATLREVSKQQRVPLYQLEGLVSFYPHFRRTPQPQFSVHVCRDVSCAMGSCSKLSAELRSRLQGRSDVEIREVSCIGRCDSAPAVSINEEPLTNCGRNVDEVLQAVLNFTLNLPGEPGGVGRRTAARRDEVPVRELTPSGSPKRRVDPYDSAETRYSTVTLLAANLDDLAAQCIDRFTAAGLRGMGGAGFPTGRKWQLVRGEPASPKYVICNADESEPGTFKDRQILSELPHLVIEGMLLAALTIGAEQGIVFLRHEYGPEQKSLEAALNEARQGGVLGANAAGSGRAFDIEVFVSPGGYILGEETALLECLEDKRGEPRNKPPYPGTYGLWGQPTLINNVETFALATAIIHHGADWWKAQGTRGCTGLKFVSISGDVNAPGVYEIPVGTTVRELIGLAGGMRDGAALQAFLPGGASSNFLPADKVDTPLDFDAMKAAGSMLGTGAVIVISDRHKLLDLATNIVRFFRNESCGKCVPCRMGSQKAVEVLEEIAGGTRPASELSLLPELGETLEQTSICGLGQVVLNPILSLMRNVPGGLPNG
ncbi:MAG: NAD(P)H-dependent oxidoreductase subunit E [Planctomycetia bacterium]|nr:NAD(P)H-dependent oxidoreductase subunit E [Planctomycetia bacterium]